MTECVSESDLRGYFGCSVLPQMFNLHTHVHVHTRERVEI